MKHTILLILLPTLLLAQEFQFRQEYDTIPVEINGWQPFVPWMGGLNMTTPELSDLDSDSDHDFFCGYFSGKVAYLKNIGTISSPNFQFETYQMEPFDPTADISFADIDNDGDKDALFGYWCYYNNGSSTLFNFQTTGDTLYDTDGNLLICPRVAIIDVERDGDFDIFAGQYYSGEIRFYENIGSPEQYSFQLTSESWLGIAVAGGAADPTFCDIDADNDYDLFVGNRTGGIYYYRNDGDSTSYNFTYITDSYNNIDVGENASPEFADIDGDGDYDLFVGRDDLGSASYSPGDIYFYENIGTPDSAVWQFLTYNYLSLDEGEKAANVSTDIDADGDYDLFLANRGNSISYFENIGDRINASFTYLTDGYQGITVNACNPFFCDIDNDEDLDLFVGEGRVPFPPYPGLHLYHNIGTPQSASFRLVTNNLVPGTYGANIKPALVDIDNDGDNDLFIGDVYHTFYFSENVGSPTIPSFSSPIEDWQGITARFFDFYDCDDDGDLDLYYVFGPAYFDFYVGIYRNIGTPLVPLFSLQTDTILGSLNYEVGFDGIDIVDIDDDEDGDIFLGVNANGGVIFFRNTTGDSLAIRYPVTYEPLHELGLSVGPNPANPVTVASFTLPAAGEVKLGIYDITGRLVKPLFSEMMLPGSHQFRWDTGNVASGVYIIKLQSAEIVQTEKVVVIR